jgi:hypothetical protein
MTQLHREFLIVIVFLCLGFCLSYFALPRHGEIMYNCSIAEINPDYPPEVKEQCRKERYKNDHT